MVPKEKRGKAEMLHQYINFHKVKKPSKFPSGGTNLVTGQNDRLKTEFAAVSMYPKERVDKLLLQRNKLRMKARNALIPQNDQKALQVLKGAKPA